ncbi:hypothetical protein ACN28S_45420 [Cystobacter fuscus]
MQKALAAANEENAARAQLLSIERRFSGEAEAPPRARRPPRGSPSPPAWARTACARAPTAASS